MKGRSLGPTMTSVLSPVLLFTITTRSPPGCEYQTLEFLSVAMPYVPLPGVGAGYSAYLPVAVSSLIAPSGDAGAQGLPCKSRVNVPPTPSFIVFGRGHRLNVPLFASRLMNSSSFPFVAQTVLLF